MNRADSCLEIGRLTLKVIDRTPGMPIDAELMVPTHQPVAFTEKVLFWERDHTTSETAEPPRIGALLWVLL